MMVMKLIPLLFLDNTGYLITVLSPNPKTVVLVIAYPFHLLSVQFAQQQVKLIHNQYCFLTGQVNIPAFD